MNDNIVLVTGGFDPLHSGHLDLINSAKEFGRVVVGLNSDEWLTRKKGAAFLSFKERKYIVSNLKNVMCVIDFNDSDGTASDAIKIVKEMFPRDKVLFANGGDRDFFNTPEESLFKDDPQVDFIFGVGGVNKKNSSSWILSNWVNNNFEQRKWGVFKTLYTNGNKVKIKELTLEPNANISLQKHQKRNEYWLIVEGECCVVYGSSLDVLYKNNLTKGDNFNVEKNKFHQLINTSDTNALKLIEIQHGEMCDEADIERF